MPPAAPLRLALLAALWGLAGTARAAPITGRAVAAEDGRPLAGARVRLFQGGATLSCGERHHLPLAETAADGNGLFALDAGPAARLTLAVEEATRPLALPLALEVPDSGDLGDIAVPAGALLEGTVTWASGEPRPGIEVVAALHRPGACGTARLDPHIEVPPHHRTRSDDEGRFRLERLAPGRWELVVVAGGILAREPVDLPPGTKRHVDLVVDGETVHGFVHEGRLRPVEGAHVLLQEVEGDTLVDLDPTANASYCHRMRPGRAAPRLHRAVTDAAGRFTLDTVMPGEYHARIRTPGTLSATRVTVAREAPELVLAASSLPLGGTVVNASSGRPVAGARIEVRPVEPGPGVIVSTGSDGAFQAGLPVPGRYRLRALALDAEWLPVETEVEVGETGATVVALAVGQEAQPELTVRASAGEGIRLSQLRVVLEDAARGSFGRTWTPSRESPLPVARVRVPRGRWRLVVHAPGSGALVSDLDLEASRALDVRLEPAGELEVAVPAGSHPHRVQIRDWAGRALMPHLLHAGASRPLAAGEGPPAALFELEPGDYRVSLTTAPDGEPVPVRVTAGERTRVVLPAHLPSAAK